MMRPAGGPRLVRQHRSSLVHAPTCYPAAYGKQHPCSRCRSGPGTLEVWTTVDIQHPRFEVRQWSDQVLVKEATNPAATPAAPQADGQPADGAAQPGLAPADGVPPDAPRPTSVLQKLQHQAFVRKAGRAPPAAAAVVVQEAAPQQIAGPEQVAVLEQVVDTPPVAEPLPAVAVVQVEQATEEAVAATAAQSQHVQQQQQQEQQQKVLSKQKTAKRAAVQQRQRQPRLSVARLLQPLAQPAPLALQAPARQDISSTAAMVCEHVHQGRSVLLSAGDASAVSKALYVAAAARVLQQARHGSSLALQPSWLGAPPAAPTSPAPATSTKHSKHQQQQQQQQQQQVAAAGLQLQVMPAAEHLLRYRPGNTLQATRQPGSWGRLVTPLAAQLQSGGSATLRAAGAGALHNALAAAAAVRQRFQAQGADLALVPRYQVMSHAEWRAGSKAGRAAAAAELVAEGVAGPVPDDDEDADEPFSAMLLQVVLVAPVQQQQQWQQQQRRARKPGRSKSRAQGTPAGVTAEAAAVEQLPGRQPPAVVLQRELVLAA